MTSSGSTSSIAASRSIRRARSQQPRMTLGLQRGFAYRNGNMALSEGFWIAAPLALSPPRRSEEHTSELQSLMRISYAVFCLKKKKNNNTTIIDREQR